MRLLTLTAALALLLATPVSADWVKLDDFQGDLSNWTTNEFFDAESEIVTDPDCGTNNVLFVGQSDGGVEDSSNAYMSLGGDNIASGDTGTLFGRMRTGGPLTETDGHFGLSTESAPDEWGDFSAYLTENGQWSVRDDGYKTTDLQPAAETWINFWIVVDNPNDEYHVYCNTTYGEDADSGDQMSHSTNDKDFAFRSGTGALAMQTLLIRASNANEDGWYLDDLYIDSSSQNLSNPVSEPALIPEPLTMVGLILSIGTVGAYAKRSYRR